MRDGVIWLTGISAGAAATFVLDPKSGRRRRRRMRDKAIHLTHRTGDLASTTTRDLRNRTLGTVASVRRRIHRSQPDDTVLEERVRAALGRVVSHPHAIAVKASGGRVALEGQILSSEEGPLISAVRTVDGVKQVDAQLRRKVEPARAPALQGSASRARRLSRLDMFQRNWSPATRALIGGTSAGLLGAGLARRDGLGVALAAAGALLAARAISNAPLWRLAGMAGRRASQG